MDDNELTKSEQVRLGKFLKATDASGRIALRHERNLRREAQETDLFTQQQGEQL